jgi:GTP-binding protein Era
VTDRRCGYVVLIGRPNAGKSTLLNQILGSKLAIISSKPQTTRDRILGVYTDEVMQAVLLDTPGVHKAWTELNRSMVRRTQEALSDGDVGCWIEDMTVLTQRVKAGQPVLDGAAEAIATMLEASGKPVIFVANKMDIVPPPLVLPVLDAISKRLPLQAAVPLSAMTGDGLADLKAELARALPVGPALFPEDQWTDASERFLAAEVIREKIFHLTEQEIPYASYVGIEQFDESEREERNLVRIAAVIVVERPQQKGIVIGKGGDMLKRIGTLARQEIQELLDCRVHLELFVKVEPNWTRTSKGLRKVGFES